jgi:hypothetical protein
MIEMGVVVGIGLLVTLVKASWSIRMWMLSHPLFMDAIIFIALTLIHWGTFSGVMVATVGALTCSLVLSTARKVYGHNDKTGYIPGLVDVSSRI